MTSIGKSQQALMPPLAQRGPATVGPSLEAQVFSAMQELENTDIGTGDAAAPLVVPGAVVLKGTGGAGVAVPNGAALAAASAWVAQSMQPPRKVPPRRSQETELPQPPPVDPKGASSKA